MDTIELRGLTFYGYHGAFDEEQRLGQRFVVDVRLGLDLEAAGNHDDLSRTVDYGKVAETVRTIVEGRPFKLIEALAEALAAAILNDFPRVELVSVRVEKPSAPIAVAPTGLVAVEITRQRNASGPEGGDQEGAGSHVVGPRTADVGPASSAFEAPDLTPVDAALRLPGGSVLAAQGIRALLNREPPMLAPLGDVDAQIQPNGIDITLESVWRMDGVGALGVTNAERVIPSRQPIQPSDDGWFTLNPSTYVVRFQEVVALPLDMMAFGRPRSSLLRSGAALHTAVWDAGYHGRSEALLVVYAEAGLRLAVGARVLQLVFVRLETATHAYAGAYQENLPSR